MTQQEIFSILAAVTLEEKCSFPEIGRQAAFRLVERGQDPPAKHVAAAVLGMWAASCSEPNNQFGTNLDEFMSLVRTVAELFCSMNIPSGDEN